MLSTITATQDDKKTIALRVPESMAKSFEKTARLLGTTNSNLLGILLKSYIDTKIQEDYESIFKAQVAELINGVSAVDVNELIAGKMGRPTREQMAAVMQKTHQDELVVTPKPEIKRRDKRRTPAEMALAREEQQRRAAQRAEARQQKIAA